MKKTILFLLFVSFANLLVDAVKTETFSISFSQSDYPISVNDDGNIEIGSKGIFSYPEANEPMLPMVAADFAVPGNCEYVSSSINVTKRLVMTNVKLAQSPLPVPTSSITKVSDSAPPNYSLKTYPESNCKFICMGRWNQASIVHFLTCPYIYDALNRNLYFIDNIEINASFNNSTSQDFTPHFGLKEKSMLRGMVKNPETVEELSVSTWCNEDNEQVDYVIITNEEIAPSFRPLLNWKKTKGLFSKIITVEEIASAYEGDDLQLKIKNCLYDLYKNNGLQFACLGGDNTVIPVRGCFGKVGNNYIDYNIPTDLFYGCFEGDFKWDANNNNIYGELEDNMDLHPNIYVSRIPVRYQQDTDNYITKLISYEQSPKINNTLLLGGVELYNTYSISGRDESDAEMFANRLFYNYIQPNWSGNVSYFFDTHTDFSGDADYNVTATNMFEQLNSGYTFVDFNTHGNKNIWSMENGGGYYTSHANKQSQENHTIIVTAACLTNAFDDNSCDPCLSESFIRNSKSGVVGYLGSSRYGWNIDPQLVFLSPSMTYEAEYYARLFSTTLPTKHFASLVGEAKASLLSNCYSQNSFRWLQFSLNPIGDPEMPIYTGLPKLFSNLNHSLGKESLVINVNVENCRICLMSNNDNGDSFYKVLNNQSIFSFNTYPLKGNLCVTHQDYIPFKLSYGFFQNETISGNNVFEYDLIKMGANITNNATVGETKVTSGTTILKAKNVILDAGTTIEKGAYFEIKTSNG